MKNFMGRTMAKMNDNRKKGRKALKGFTLVEIIVVLVILAILAAAMIPALTGYIEKAKNKTLVAEARNAVTAAQTLASEAYGLGKTMGTDANYGLDDIETLAEVPDDASIAEVKFSKKGKVLGLIYEKDGMYVLYQGGEFADPATAKPSISASSDTSSDDISLTAAASGS